MLQSKKMVKLSGVRLSLLNQISRITLMKTVSFCPQDHIIGHPRNRYILVADRETDTEDDKSASILSAPGSSTLTESNQQRPSPRGGGCDAFVQS